MRKREVAATVHTELDPEQKEEMDRYCEQYGVFTRTAIIDEALSEFFAKRSTPKDPYRWPRRYGQKSGPTQRYNRRSTDRETT